MKIELKDVDKRFYGEYLQSFIPEKIIDIHAHLWLKEHQNVPELLKNGHMQAWPLMVAPDCKAEDLDCIYKTLFPDKKVTPLIFASLPEKKTLDVANKYVKESAKKYKWHSLVWSDPVWNRETLKQQIVKNGFLGIKCYMNGAPSYIPTAEIRIFDYFPPHHLELLNELGLIAVIHIPRSKRLADELNIAQLMEIDANYPEANIVVAHVGRAYCKEDIGNAFKIFKKSKNILFDISANTNEEVFRQLLETVGPKRVLFGSDMPILTMRSRRICENGFYVNLVPKGLYGDLSSDKHMREVSGNEAEALTFLIYEEIAAILRAAKRVGLSSKDVEDIFYNNAMRIIGKAKKVFKN
jgi:predicted TIM-barrel fold metal-dependent hydrolase